MQAYHNAYAELAGANVDKELDKLSKSIDRSLAPLRREIDKAERKAGTGSARLLREATLKGQDIPTKIYAMF